MNRYLILASLLLVASCATESTGGAIEPNMGAEVTLTAPLTDAETRIAVDTESGDRWTFAWEDGDAIAAWHSEIGNSPLNFAMSNFDGDDSAFSGTLGSGDYHRFIYPNDINLVSGDTFSIDVSYQISGEELAKTYMINDAPIETALIENGEVSSLSMKHVGSFMVVDVYLSDYVASKTYRLKGVKYSSEDDVICTSAVIDMTKAFDDDDLYSSISSGSVMAIMNEPFVAVADDPDYIQAITRLNIMPSVVAQGDSVTVELTVGVYDSDDDDATLLETQISSVTLTNNSGNDLPFARATHNFTYLTVDGSYGITITGATINGWSTELDYGEVEKEEVTTYTASEISDSNIPTDDTWIITDSGEITYDLMSGVRAAISLAYDADRMISISMPNATKIGEMAFDQFYALESVKLPEVTSIGEAAFSGCTHLTSINLPEAISIGDRAFFLCYSIASVELPKATSIGKSAFTDSHTFTSLVLPNVISIADYAFNSCYGMRTLELPKVTSIGEQAFYCCSHLTTFKLTTESEITCGVDPLLETYPTNITLYISEINNNVTNLTDGTYDFYEIIYND